MEEDVGTPPSEVTILWLISSTSLGSISHDFYGFELIQKDLRFDTQDIAQSPHVIAVLSVCLTHRVDEVDTDDPLILSELDFSAEIVHVSDQGGKDLSVSWLGLWAHEINDMLSEVWVEFAVAVWSG